MKKQCTSYSILYQNTDFHLKKQINFLCICMIIIIVSVIIIKSDIQLSSIYEYLPHIFGVIVFYTCVYFVISCYNIAKNRNVIIDEKGIHTYWISPDFAHKFVPFTEIATCYISKAKQNKIQMTHHVLETIPIVFDAGITGSQSMMNPDGKDLIIFTKNYEEISINNLDNVSKAFNIVKNNITKENFETKNSESNLQSTTVTYENISTLTSLPLKEDEEILFEFKDNHLKYILAVVILAIITIDLLFLPLNFSLFTYIFTDLIILSLGVLVFFLRTTDIVQITTKRMTLIKRNQVCTYTASDLHYFKMIEPFIIVITTKDGLEHKYSYSFYLKNRRKLIQAINIMMLIEAKVISPRCKISI